MRVKSDDSYHFQEKCPIDSAVMMMMMSPFPSKKNYKAIFLPPPPYRQSHCADVSSYHSLLVDYFSVFSVCVCV